MLDKIIIQLASLNVVDTIIDNTAGKIITSSQHPDISTFRDTLRSILIGNED